MRDRIDLIASNSCSSNFARLVMGSVLMNSYCIGLPGARLYGGCTFIDMIEREVHMLARRLFGNANHVVVQFLSGMQANIGAYHAILQPGDTIIAAQTKHGGHYSHTISGPLRFFSPRIVPIPFDEAVYNVDLNKLEDVVKQEKPKLMILGWSEFLFPHPLELIRKICDKYSVKLMYDMSHVVGLIAGGVFQPDVMRYADIITSSTGKSLHGPDHGLVMFNDDSLKAGVLEAVMPLLTSNTHPHEVAALGVAFSEMLQFGNAYAKQVIANAKALGRELDQAGVNVLYKEHGYTESHTILLQHKQANAAVDLLDRAGVLINACQLPWDEDGMVTGLRLGTQVLARHGYTEKDMPRIAEIISDVLLKDKEPEFVHFSMVQPFAKRFTHTHFSFDEKFPAGEEWYEKIFKSYKAETPSSILRGHPAFAHSSMDEIALFQNYFELLKVKKGEVLFEMNDMADAVYFVAHGAIDIVDTSNERKSIIITLRENTNFGELGVIDGHRRRYAARAHESSLLLKIKGVDFIMILKRFYSIDTYFKRYPKLSQMLPYLT